MVTPFSKLASTLAALLTLSGCASDGGQCPDLLGSAYPSPAAVSRQARGHDIGAMVTWGGQLLAVRHLAETTELEVSARALDGGCQPRLDDAALGRFLVRYPGYLETADFAPGQGLRVSGRLAGIEPGVTGGPPLPVVSEPSMHWAERNGYGPLELAAPSGRPRISIGVGAGSGWSGGGIGISF